MLDFDRSAVNMDLEYSKRLPSGFLTALGCTKLVLGRGSAPDPTGGAYSAPQTPQLV